MSRLQSPSTGPPALQMDVGTSVLRSGGKRFSGPRFQLIRGHRRPAGAFDWDVRQLNHQLETIATGTVFGHQVWREPLLCLAARGAWSLWNDNTPLLASDRCNGLVIEVTYGVDAISFIQVAADHRGSRYIGSCAGNSSGMAAATSCLSLTTLDSVRRRDVGHWIRAVLSELAFGDVKPLPSPTVGSAPRELPSCWSVSGGPVLASG